MAAVAPPSARGIVLLRAGSSVLERFAGLLAAALEDAAGILPDEAARLELYRRRHNLSLEEALDMVSSNIEEYESRVQAGEELHTYLLVVAATLQQSQSQSQTQERAVAQDANARLALYREVHGVSAAVHAAAMQVLGLPRPTTAGGVAHAPAEERQTDAILVAYRKLLASAPPDDQLLGFTKNGNGMAAPGSCGGVRGWSAGAIGTRGRDDSIGSEAAGGASDGGDAVDGEAHEMVHEMALSEYRAAHGISAAQHALAVDALGHGGLEASSKRTDWLERRLRRFERENAQRSAELEQATIAIQQADTRMHAHTQTSPALRVQAGALEAQLDKVEASAAKLRASNADRQIKLAVVQSLMDAREAELEETEAAVRRLEQTESQRARELFAGTSALACTEGAMLAIQRELMRLQAMSDGTAAELWKTPSKPLS